MAAQRKKILAQEKKLVTQEMINYYAGNCERLRRKLSTATQEIYNT
jgi:uncharacterized protein (UPF0216 family)